MAGLLTPKRLKVPGVFTDEAFQERLKQFSDQQKSAQQAAPPPNSAFDMADKIQRDFLTSPEAKVAVSKLREPSTAGGDELRAKTQTSAARLALSPLGYMLSNDSPIGRLGQLTPEEQQAEAVSREQDAKEVQKAVESHAETRARLRGMSDEEAAALGLPVPPGGTGTPADDELRAEEAARDAAAVAKAREKTDTASKAVRGEADKPTQTWWLNAAQSGARGAAAMGMSGLKYLPIIWEQYEAALTGSSEKSTLRKGLDVVDKQITAMLPGDKARSQDFMTKLSAGTGSFAAFMLAGYVGNMLRLPTTLAPALLGAATEGTSMYEDAERFGATGMQKFLTLMLGSGLGLTEAIPISRMLMRAERAYGGAVTQRLIQTAAGSMEEFIQELGQSVGEDVVAKYMAGYDPDRVLDPKGWLENGAIGAITGFGGSIVAQIADAAGVQVEDAQQEQLIHEVIQEHQREIDRTLGGTVAEDGVAGFEPEIDRPVTPAPAAAVEGLETGRRTPPPDGVELTPTDPDLSAELARRQPEPTAEDYLARANAPMHEGRGGLVPVNEDGLVELTHWSNEQRDVLDPTKMGTGPLRGTERQRLSGPEAAPRTYYGVNAVESMPVKELRKVPYDVRERGGYLREGGLGGWRHTVLVDPDRIYNWYDDPLGLKAQLDRSKPTTEVVTDYENLIKDAGFDGAFISPTEIGQSVIMFTPETPLEAPPDFEAMTSPEKQRELAQQVPGLRGVLKHLTDEEKGRIKKRTAARLVEIFESMPDPKEMAAVALSGRAKRGWYARSAKALVDIFGVEDAPRFAALLAALSPQTSVESNAINAIRMWTAWSAASRPQNRPKIMALLGASVQGGKGEDSVLPAWVDNTMRALTATDATQIRLSGPKVNSFMANLQGVTNEVTNDAWIANYANIDQALLKSSYVKIAGDKIGDKGVGYLAMSATVRAAAETATRLTGETWTPAEVQETVWSWAKALYENADAAGENRNAEQILKAGGLTSEQISAIPDFASLFAQGVYRKLLEEGGYDPATGSDTRVDGADGPRGSVTSAEGTGLAQSAFDRHLRRAARRLDALRKQRAQQDADNQGEDGQAIDAPDDNVSGDNFPGDTPAQAGGLNLDETFDGFDPLAEFDFMMQRVPDADLQPLPGLPSSSTGPIPSVVAAARAYAASIGLPFRRQQEYVKVDKARATRIAEAYEAMKHDPEDPAVKAAFRAMADETLAQYQFVKASGLDIDFIEEGQPDPYPEGPRQVLDDLTRGHLWVFPTEQGFGTMTEAERTNPLLEETDEVVKGRKLVANDVFRIVHDFFGHGIEGSGFGARGEENAWQSHMRLYTDAALPAVTSETRGQNSWVNYGPHGEANRANQRETVYADQKTGLMPEWTWREGVADDATTEASYPDAPEAQTASARAPFIGEQSRPRKGIPTPPDYKPGDGDEDLSLRQISKNFIKAIGLVARQGRFTLKGSNVMGQYSRRSTVVRLRTWSDLSTLVHEAGHALHDSMSGPLDRFVKDNSRLIQRIAVKLYGGDLSKSDVQTREREGFAEFLRVFTLNREFARRKFPEVTASFEQLLRDEAPELGKTLEGVGAQFAAWLQLPSARALANTIKPGYRATGINAAIADLREVGFKTWWQEAGRGVLEQSINRNASMNKMVADMLNLGEQNQTRAIDLMRADDPRVLVRLARNAGNRAMVQTVDGVMAYHSVQPSTRGLREAMLRAHGRTANDNLRRIDKDVMGDLDTYLVALRALDEYRRLDEGLIDRAPVQATRGDLQVVIKELEAKYGTDFTDAAEIVNEYGMGLWQKQYDAGLMTKETYKEGLERRFYAPLQRDLSDRNPDAFGPSAVTGGTGRRMGGRFRGSDRDIVSPFTVLMQKTFALETTIAQNDVLKALGRLSDRVGKAGAMVERVPATQIMGQQFSVLAVARALTKDENLTETDAADLMTLLQGAVEDGSVINMFRSEQASTKGENILFYWENGKLSALQLADGGIGADVLNLMQGLGRENMNFGMDTIAMTSTAFRSAITSWPDFLAVNFVRDQMSAWILTDVGFKPFVSGARGISEEIRRTKWARMYNASMGVMGGMNVAALHDARVNRDMEALKAKGYLATAFRGSGVLGAVRGMAKVVELTETGTRLGIYRRAYERAVADGLDEWQAAIEAGYTATDYIDFGLNGSRMLHARRLIPFLNAQLQGLYKMMRTLGGDEVAQRKGLRFALKAYFKNVNNLDLSRTERQALQTGRKAWVKMGILGLFSAALHFLFADDPDYQDASEYLRQTGWVIPLGDGRIFYIPKPFELAIVANAVERGLESASGDREAKNRFMRGLAMSFAPPTSPPAIQVVVEEIANKDFFSGREIVPTYMQALTPQLQFNNYTSEMAKGIGEITGLSPMRVDHIMSGLGASAYRDIATMTDALNPEEPSMDATDMPLLRRFVRDSRRGAATSRDFWAQASMTNGKLRQGEVTYRRYLDEGSEAAAQQFLKTLSSDEQAYALLGAHFNADAKRLNPYYRGRQITTVISGMRREIGSDRGLNNTAKWADSGIRLTAREKAEVDEVLSEIARREIRNTLIAMGAPGWENKARSRVDTSIKLLEATDLRTAEELKRRYAKAKVYSAKAVFEYWPEARDRLLTDGDAAFLKDIVSIAKVMP